MIADVDVKENSLLTCLTNREATSVAYLQSKGLMKIGDLVSMPRSAFQRIIDDCPTFITKVWCVWLRNVAIDSVEKKSAEALSSDIKESVSQVGFPPESIELLSLQLQSTPAISPLTIPATGRVPVRLLNNYLRSRARITRAFCNQYVAYCQQEGVVSAAQSLQQLVQQCSDLRRYHELSPFPLLLCVPGAESSHSITSIGDVAVYSITAADLALMVDGNGAPILEFQYETDSIWTTRVISSMYRDVFSVTTHGGMLELVDALRSTETISTFMWLRSTATDRITLLLSYASDAQYRECCYKIWLHSNDVVADIALQPADATRVSLSNIDEEYTSPFSSEYCAEALILLDQLQQPATVQDITKDYNLVGIFPWVRENHLTLLVLRMHAGYTTVHHRDQITLSALIQRYGSVEFEATAEAFSPLHRQNPHKFLCGGVSIGNTLAVKGSSIKPTRGTLSYCAAPNVGVTAGHCLDEHGSVVVQPAVEDLRSLMGHQATTGYTAIKGEPYRIGSSIGALERRQVAVPRSALSGPNDTVQVSVDVGVFSLNNDKVPEQFDCVCIEPANSEEYECSVTPLQYVRTWDDTLMELSMPERIYNLCGATTHSSAKFRCASAGVVNQYLNESKKTMAAFAGVPLPLTTPAYVVDYNSSGPPLTLVNQLLMDGTFEQACAKGDSGAIFYADLPGDHGGLAVGQLHIGLCRKNENSSRFAIAAPMAGVVAAVQQLLIEGPAAQGSAGPTAGPQPPLQPAAEDTETNAPAAQLAGQKA